MPGELTTTILQQQTVVGNWLKTLPFNQFDPTLGTLLNIRVSIADQVNGSVAMENLGPAVATMTAPLSGMVSVTGPAQISLGSSGGGAPVTLQLAGFDGMVDFAGGSGALASNVSGSGTTDFTHAATNPSFAAFVGQGTIDLTASGLVTNTLVSGGGSFRLQSSANIGAVIGLQYQYEVPAPVGGGGGSSGSGFTNVITNAPR